MQISGIAKQLLSPLSFGSSSSAEPEPTKKDKSSEESTGLGCIGPAFHEILSHYDVERITPHEFSDLIQQLHAAGEIDDGAQRELNRLRAELDESGVAPDEPLNLLDYLADQIKSRQDELGKLAAGGKPGATAEIMAGEKFVADRQRQLQWVRKFALVHAAGAEALDTGA